MNPSSRASPRNAARIALKTKWAGSIRRINSETNSIAHSKARLRAAGSALLIRTICGHVLPGRKSQLQAAAPGSRGKTAELIDQRELFGARREKNASSVETFFPSDLG